MWKILPLITLLLVSIGCGSSDSTPQTSNSSASKSNSNTNNIVPFSRTENAHTTASNSELGRLTPAGKSATDLIGKTASEAKMWSKPVLVQRLQSMMGSEYGQMRRLWNIETPIRKFGDFLMMSGCEKENCSANRYVIVIDMADGIVNVIRIKLGETKLWKENEEIELPPPFADEFAEMKAAT